MPQAPAGFRVCCTSDTLDPPCLSIQRWAARMVARFAHSRYGARSSGHGHSSPNRLQRTPRPRSEAAAVESAQVPNAMNQVRYRAPRKHQKDEEDDMPVGMVQQAMARKVVEYEEAIA